MWGKPVKEELEALKRKRILEVTKELVFENGYGSTTLEAVADRLGVTKPFIYSRFANKSLILAELCLVGAHSAVNAAEEALALEGTATEKLIHLVRQFARGQISNRANVALYFREEKNLSPEAALEITKLRKAFDRKLGQVLKEGVAIGEFQISDIKLAALAIGGMIAWSYTWYRPDGRLSETKISNLLADMVLNLVRARPAK